MLLANMQVAEKIANTFPDTALLRRHPPPLARRIKEVADFCDSTGLGQIDASSAGSLAKSLEACKAKNPSAAVHYAVHVLCTKPMQLAKYFCTGSVDIDDWRHYALNVHKYTHFTSPIRRYADLIVHRLLDAAIMVDNSEHGGKVPANFKQLIASLPDSHDVDKIAAKCNDRKAGAKKAQEASGKLYLLETLKKTPLCTHGIVLSVEDRFISCLAPEIDTEKRVYVEDLPLDSFLFDEEHKRAVLHWPNGTVQEITQLSLVRLVVGASTTAPVDFTFRIEPSTSATKIQ